MDNKSYGFLVLEVGKYVCVHSGLQFCWLTVLGLALMFRGVGGFMNEASHELKEDAYTEDENPSYVLLRRDMLR